MQLSYLSKQVRREAFFLELFEPRHAGDPRYPFAVQTEQTCTAAMVPNVPAVVYVKNPAPYFKMWEAQYLQDLLRGVSTNLTLCEISHWKSNIEEILRHGEATESPIGLIVSTNQVQLNDLANVMQSLHKRHRLPRLLIHLSDEVGNIPPGDSYNRIVGEDGLVLRQYRHPSYNLASRPLVLTMPLGYAADAPFSANSCEASESAQSFTQREYDWAFIGTVYAHRVEMMNTLSNDRRFHKHYVGKLPAADMLKVYKKSTFVPVGRGHRSLDCFRIYESIISGAIPVVVGAKKEIDSTFAEHNGIPMVVASDWKAAADKMSRLLGSPEELRALQADTARWVCKTIGSLRAQLADQWEPKTRRPKIQIKLLRL
eukprot:gnl/TRDRNA2_/TRDRNA2_128289_c0_seq1.p1 gnl/TRDRNA2_/TRDRNA2_128289_c0~~gnl/TRDRNA2_/TRDRNA2_128289_c0_seq1.p1  ORF type:complete len:371 (-),score=2.78 gnl/TRDRNA2_/TRDRNA2_128289_c0_seq1:10-1122(-)